jgi:hypothetical protein
MPKRTILSLALALFLGLTAGCTLDSREHDELKALKEEYLVQISELRQANDTINRNITATYLELEALKARLGDDTGAGARP